MKTDSTKQNLSPRLETYRNIISGIEFMEKYMEDPNILSPSSPKFNMFLIQAFSYLHSDFHYLSFLNKDDVDSEIVKAAKMLQILPTENTNKLFDNMLEDDIKKFWFKFFNLFNIKKQIDSRGNSIFSFSWESKIDFFKEIQSTLNYLNYEFSVVNVKKLSNSDIDKEINKWKEAAEKPNTFQDDSSFIYDEEKMVDVNIEKLFTDLKQVVSMYQDVEPVKNSNEPEHLEFFTNFIYLTKNILQYVKHLNIINSTVLNELNYKMILNNASLSETLYFIKRCNNLMNTLKSKQHCMSKI